MFNVGGGELLVIFLVALVVLGPQRLPEAAKQVGAMIRELKKVSTGFQDELKSAMDFSADDDQIEAEARARGDQLVAAEKAEKAASATRAADAKAKATSTAASAGMYTLPAEAKAAAAQAEATAREESDELPEFDEVDDNAVAMETDVDSDDVDDVDDEALAVSEVDDLADTEPDELDVTRLAGRHTLAGGADGNS